MINIYRVHSENLIELKPITGFLEHVHRNYTELYDKNQE